MHDIDEIRRENLRAESKRLGGDADLAKALGVDKNQIYQWMRTKDPKQIRTMRKTTARAAEKKLNRPPGWLDVPQTEIGVATSLPAGMAESRSKNNVKALRFAVQSLFSVLHAQQSDIAAAVARDIVETAGTEFSGQGFLNTLVGILRGEQQTSEAESQTTQPAQVSKASKRAASAAKRPS